MISIYIWDFQGKEDAWGHASMKVTGGTPPGEIYISWWPESKNRIGQIPYVDEIERLIGNEIPYVDDIYTVSAIKNRTYKNDVAGEGGDPNRTIIFTGLDETKIKTWWENLLRNTHAQWTTLGQNCSTTVAQALAVGAAGDIVSSFGWLSTWNTVWKPDDVLYYALEIKKAIAKNGIWHCGERDCPTHRSHDDRCASGVWTCGRLEPPCPGHSSPDHVCTLGNAWRCGARDCSTHKSQKHCCVSGTWACGRRILPCSGHSSPHDNC